ncbi:diaminopimelate decarboxylase family protein [Candidatus Vidania fulgoroideorum]
MSTFLNHLYQRNNCPLFIYSNKAILANLYYYIRAGFKIFYALKANYNYSLIILLSTLGCGFEVVSIFELKYLIFCGVDVRAVIFSGVCKSKADLLFALRVGVGFVSIDSFSEMGMLADLLGYVSGVTTLFFVRFNLNINVNTNADITTCTFSNKFGIYEYQAGQLFALAARLGIAIYGLSFHLGSQVLDLLPYMLAFSKLYCISKIYCLHIKAINMGGGIGIDYIFGNYDLLATMLLGLVSVVSFKLLIFVEPGRSIIANSCVTLAKVVCLKANYLRNFIVLDVGMDMIIRPALYASSHRLAVVSVLVNLLKFYYLVGPICESTDVFCKGVLPSVAIGNYVFIYDTGAYCLSMRMNYNMRSKPFEVFI